jgi:hypothetical protein
MGSGMGNGLMIFQKNDLANLLASFRYFEQTVE